jgi:hypothetical protein
MRTASEVLLQTRHATLRGIVRRVAVVLLVAALPMALVAGPKVEVSWKNPEYSGPAKFKRVLVVALNGQPANRVEFEDELVAAINRPAQKAEASYEYMLREEGVPIDEKDLRALIRDHDFDAVLIARLAKHETKTTYVPGQVYQPMPYYSTLYGYYHYVAPPVYTPGYMETEKTAQVEVNFYAVVAPDGQLVWTGMTNTFDAGSAMKAIKKLVKVISKELEKQNIVPAQ